MSNWQDIPLLPDVPIIMGADNGKTGFLVFLASDNAEIIHIEQYPDDAKRLHQLISYFKPAYATIEAVFMAPGFKGVASSNFEIMGRYMQTFELLDIPYETARAKTWRAHLGIKAKGREACKQAAIETCKTLFEKDYGKLHSDWSHIVDHHRVIELVPDNNKCESALIAYYALQKWREKNAN